MGQGEHTKYFTFGDWYVTGRVIYTKTWYADRNDHTTITAPLPVCSVKLTGVNTTILGQKNLWKTWNQNMMMPMTEEKISGQLTMKRQPFLTKL